MYAHIPGILLFMDSSLFGEGNGNPLQCSCLENPRDGGAWRAAVYGVTQSRTWLKRLSSSSSLYLVFYMNRIILFPAQFFKKYAVFIFALLFKLFISLNTIKILLSLYFSHLLVVFIVVGFFIFLGLEYYWTLLVSDCGIIQRYLVFVPCSLNKAPKTLGLSQGIKGARNVFCSQQWSDSW